MPHSKYQNFGIMNVGIMNVGILIVIRKSPSGVLPDEPESLPTSGVMMSPNFPANYPNDLHERKTIEVAKGSVINIHFTDYELESPDQVDYLEVTDGDGALLGHFGAAHYVDNGKLFLF